MSKKTETKKRGTRKIIIGLLCLLIIALVIFIAIFCNKLKHETNLKEQAKLSAQKYVESTNLQFDDIVSIPLKLLKDSEFLGYFDDKCLEASYVIVKKNNDGYEYNPVIICDNSKAVLKLNGEPIQKVEVGDDYIEQGAALEGSLVNDVDINNNVNTNKKGTYSVIYSVPGSDIPPVLRVIEVVDTTKPIITLKNSDILYLLIGDNYQEYSYKAIDNYDGDITSKVTVEGSVDTSKAGTYYITYTVKDSSDNTTSVKRQIIVRENTPTISLKGYATVYVDVFGKYVEEGYTATDKMGNNLTKKVVIEGNVNPNVVGEYVITYKVTSSTGAIATARRVVKVVDTTKPEISLNGSDEVILEWDKDTYHELGAIATDNYDGNITDKIKITGIFNPNKIGTYYLAYTVSDSSGNKSTVQRIIKIVDKEAPIISLIGDETIYVEAGTEYNDLGVVVSDNYDKEVTVETNGSVNTDVLGNYTITYIATDVSGNKTSITRNVIVRDTTAPIITLKGNTTINLDLGTAYVESGYTATDNYDKYVNNNVVVSGTVDHNVEGTYYITYNVTDVNGNIAIEVTRTVIVKDTIAPTITTSTDDLFNENNFVKKATVKATINDINNTIASVRYAWTDGTTPTNWIEYPNYVEDTEIILEQLTDGTYYLFIEATDASGNVKVSKIGPFKVDTTVPTVNFVPNGATGSTISTKPGVKDTFSGIDKIYYAWSNDNTTAPSNYIEYTNTDLTQNTDGTYYLWIKAIDKAGNEIETVSNAFIVDNAYPTIEFTYPSNSTIVKEAIVDVMANGNSGKTIEKVEYIWTKSAIKPTEGFVQWTNYEDDHTIIMPNDLDGEYYLWIKATDSLGLVSYNSSRMITLDNTKPTIDITNNGSISAIKNIEIDITIVDNNIDKILWAISKDADINNVTLSNSISDLISKIKIEGLDGTYYLHIIATDKAGNYTEFTSSSFLFDNTAPAKPEITFDNNWTKDDLLVTINGTDKIEVSFDNENWVEYTSELTVSANTKIYAKATDKAGNVSEISSKEITNIDKENPTIDLDYKTDITNKIEVSYKIEDKISNIDKIYYAWTTDEIEPTFTLELSESNGTITKEDVNGKYYLWIKAVDKAGNEVITKTSLLTLDKENPVIDIISGNGTNGPVTKADTTINITDDTNMDIKYIFTNNTDKPEVDAAWTSWYDYSDTNNTLTLDNKFEDGIYYLHIEVVDVAGNTTCVVSNVYTLINSLPEVKYDPATNLDYNVTINSTVSAKLENATINNLYYAWSTKETADDTLVWTEFNNGDTITKDDVTGAYYLYIKVIDNVDGNRITIIRSTGTFNLDKDNVNVSFNPNGTNGPVKEVETEIIATDNHSGIDSIKYAWGTSNIISPDVSTFIDYELGTTIKKTTENSYETLYLWVAAKDLAGNENYTVSNAFEIDNSYPTIDLDPNRSNPVNEITIKVTINVDANKTINNLYYAWTNTSTVDENTIWTNWDLTDYENDNTLSQTGLNGTYYLHVKVVDNNGLESIKSTYALVFDNTAPVITINPESSLTSVKEIEPNISVIENNNYDVFYNFSTEVNSNLAIYEAWTDFMGQGEDTLVLGGNGYEGTYYLHIKVVDEAGNVTYKTASYEFDNTAPNKPTVSFDNNWTNEDIEMTINGTDILEYSFDNITWLTYDINSKPVMTQNGSFYVRSKDEAGNISEVLETSLSNIDKEDPKAEISFNTTDWTNKDVVISLTIDNLSPIKSIRWSPIELTISDYMNGRGYKVNVDTKAFAQGVNRPYIQIFIEDEAGNVTLLTTSVTNIDKEAPEIIVNPSEVTIDEKTDYDVFQGVSVKDNVGFGDNKLTATEISSELPGVYTVTYTITDIAGNTTTVTRKITVLDKTAPEITLNGNDQITLEWGKDTYTELGATATDNVDGDITANIIITGNVDVTTLGTYTITYTISDLAGNAASITRTVKVIDTIKPEITLNGSDEITLEWGKDNYTELGVTATDNHDGDISSNVIITGSVDINTLGTYTITYMVKDSSNNESVVLTRTVKVVDTIKPEIELNGNDEITLEWGKDTYTELGVTATDNHDGDISSNVIITGSVDINTLGTYTITYMVKDSSNNESVVLTRTVKVVDTIKPEITLNGNNEITLEWGKDTYTELGVTVTDNHDGDITANIIITGNVDVTTLGTYTITYTITDSSLNTTTITRTVKVVDTTAPVITLNGNDEITLEWGKDTYTELGVTATDNYDGDISSNVIITGSVDVNTLGVYTITYVVIDTNNNISATLTRTVKVIDTIKPTINLNGNANITLEVGSTYTELGTIATDNYDGDISSNVIITGSVDINTLGTYTITYMVKDSSNNESIILTRTINVVDTTKPTINLNGNANITLEVGSTYTELGAIAADNYDGDITSNIEMVGTVDINALGTYTITYMVKDSSNNESIILTRTVKVVDTTKPTINLNGNSNIRLEVGNPYTELGATAIDNYDGDISSKVVITGIVNANVLGTYTITYTVIDASGNSATTTRTVTVYDEEAPIITLKGNNEVNVTLGNKYIEEGYIITDNYDTNLVADITNNINYDKVGSYKITYNVTDSNGNKAITVTRTINVLPATLDELFRESNNCEANTNCFSLSNAQNNYIWYSGYLFRIYKSNIDGSVKLITEGSIASLSYDDDSSIFKGSVIQNWLNDTFYNSLNKNDQFIANGNYCNTNTSDANNNRTTCTTDGIVASKIGLLTLFEYNLVGGKNSYLNNQDYFATMTRYGAKSVWAINAFGDQVDGDMVYNVDGVRPVITLVNGINAISGNGTESNPYRLENDNSANTNDKLNDRFTGEYVSYNNQLWRIVTNDNNGTKLILDGYLKDENGNIIETSYGLNNIYGNSNVLSIMNSNLPTNNLLNTVWYKGTFAAGQNPIGTSIKTSGDYSNHQFGLIRIGELMSGKGATLNMGRKTYWTMTMNSDGTVWHISTTGGAATDKLDAPRAIRPVIKVNNSTSIKTGQGTYTNPYVLN